MRPTPEFLSTLIKGQRVIVDNGAAGRVMGRIADITPKLIIVRMGTEKRRFLRADGGTFQAPSMSKSWLLPLEDDNA